MISKIVAPGVVVLAVGTGVAYAATQLASTDDTQVCVNQTNGLMRASSSCRDGEYAMTIGGGSNVVVTQNGTSILGPGQRVAKTLPSTGIGVTVSCELRPATPPFSFAAVLAQVRLDAATGQTMDIPIRGVYGGTSLTLTQATGNEPDPTTVNGNHNTLLMTSNGATATFGVDAEASWTPQRCTFLWQATEAPN